MALSFSAGRYCLPSGTRMGAVTLVSKSFKFPGGFPGGAVVENLPVNARDTGSSPGLGRSHMPQSN